MIQSNLYFVLSVLLIFIILIIYIIVLVKQIEQMNKLTNTLSEWQCWSIVKVKFIVDSRVRFLIYSLDDKTISGKYGIVNSVLGVNELLYL